MESFKEFLNKREKGLQFLLDRGISKEAETFFYSKSCFTIFRLLYNQIRYEIENGLCPSPTFFPNLNLKVHEEMLIRFCLLDLKSTPDIFYITTISVWKFLKE